MKITINNRLAVLIRLRKINSASEFARRMTNAGFRMSSSHASRYEKENPPAFDLHFINVACNVLQCLPNELYHIEIELEPGEEIEPMIIFPHHAMVKQAGPLAQAGDNSQKSQQTLAKKSPKAEARKQENQKSPAKNDEFNNDTGPSGALFPFIKK